MTKIQRLEEQIQKDDEMCRKINEVLDGTGRYKDWELPAKFGAIMAQMEIAGRRTEK